MEMELNKIRMKILKIQIIFEHFFLINLKL